MQTQRQIKLFRNGRNQALRIPREFELPGDRAIIRREGDHLVIEPVAPQPLLDLLATLRPLDEDFPEIEELPVEPVDF
jgi:antitoxin VapB